MQNHKQLIGGPGIIVEIDESKFGKRKYHRGHRVDGAWVFGGIERTPEKRVFAQIVEDRTEATLLRVIEENIHPESIIHSDLWKRYQNISNYLDMQHETVNHSQHFKDPETGVLTNTIEGIWNGFKIAIPSRNRSKDNLDQRLLAKIWRRVNNDNLWNMFLTCLRETVVN